MVSHFNNSRRLRGWRWEQVLGTRAPVWQISFRLPYVFEPLTGLCFAQILVVSIASPRSRATAYDYGIEKQGMGMSRPALRQSQTRRLKGGVGRDILLHKI
jgi:hypothetical protein